MRALAAILLSVTYSAASWSTPWLSPVRDGSWLQNGIKQQQRSLAQENLSDKELGEATQVVSYVCAVVDFEKELTQRAALLSAAVQQGQKRKHLDAHLLEGMRQSAQILAPLVKSEFNTDGVSCERAMVMVQEYLVKYPEMLDKDAATIVERALLASYDRGD
jgi:hypothetical protein